MDIFLKNGGVEIQSPFVTVYLKINQNVLQFFAGCHTHRNLKKKYVSFLFLGGGGGGGGVSMGFYEGLFCFIFCFLEGGRRTSALPPTPQPSNQMPRALGRRGGENVEKKKKKI